MGLSCARRARQYERDVVGSGLQYWIGGGDGESAERIVETREQKIKAMK